LRSPRLEVRWIVRRDTSRLVAGKGVVRNSSSPMRTITWSW
jgi:hypothetical protein